MRFSLFHFIYARSRGAYSLGVRFGRLSPAGLGLAYLSFVGGALAQNEGAGQREEGSDVSPSEGEEKKSAAGNAGVSRSEDTVRLSDRAELERIIELYMAGQYASCSEELEHFLDPKTKDPFEEARVIEGGRLYYASCTLLEGRRDAARKALRQALEENPLMHSPDSLTFPPPVVSLFLEVRDEVQQLIAESEKEQVVRLRRENELARRRAEQRQFRERELEKLARKEFVVAQNSRFLAAIPFGVGQFQNGSPVLGGAFLATETLLFATAVASGLVLADLSARAAQGDGQVVEVERFNKQRESAHKTLTWSSWAFVGTAALGILEAQLRFEPERRLRERRRTLPPELEISPEPERADKAFKIDPEVGVAPNGAYFGLRGTF